MPTPESRKQGLTYKHTHTSARARSLTPSRHQRALQRYTFGFRREGSSFLPKYLQVGHYHLYTPLRAETHRRRRSAVRPPPNDDDAPLSRPETLLLPAGRPLHQPSCYLSGEPTKRRNDPSFSFRRTLRQGEVPANARTDTRVCACVCEYACACLYVRVCVCARLRWARGSVSVRVRVEIEKGKNERCLVCVQLRSGQSALLPASQRGILPYTFTTRAVDSAHR